MDFEELQVIWKSQNNEKMYVINENALHAYIKRKGQSINRILSLFEVILISVNLVVGIWLTIESLDNNNLSPQSILAVFYLTFAVYGLIRRLMRHKEEKPFAHTMLGELDKAIWRIDYLVWQGRNVIVWYLLPLALLFAVMSYFDARLLPASGMLLVLLVATYFGYRWEINKLHLPHKHNLEVLRDKLVAQENQ